MKRYVWLNVQTGKFSNSWDEEQHKYLRQDHSHFENNPEWKLIEYNVLNDEEFEFKSYMGLK